MEQKNNPPSIGNCPKCGGKIRHGKYGYYCEKKYGMTVGKVFGKVLTKAQLAKLLSGRTASFVRGGRTTIVLPEVEQSEYLGKLSYQWSVKKA